MHTCTDQCSYGSSRHVRGRPWGAGLIDGLAVVAAMSVVLATFGPVQAAVFQCPAGDAPCLIASINTANGNGEDDTIQLEAGTYILTAVDNETDGPNGLPSITSPITITGAGADTTIIERDGSALQFRILHVAVAGTLTLDGLTIRGGGGGGIFVPFDGGGLLNKGGTVSIISSTFAGNSTTALGGGIFNNGPVTIINSTLADNRADSGSGLWNSGTVTITNSLFSNNDAAFSGGAIAHDTGGTMTIINSTFSDNHAASLGGAIVNGGLLTIRNSTLTGNSSDFEGGAIFHDGDPVTIINSTLVSNTALIGGGIFNFRGTVAITNSTLASNTEGGLFNAEEGTAIITNSTVANNSGDSGIFNAQGTVTITNSTIAGNSGTSGGGIFNILGALELQNVILALNTAEGQGPDCSSISGPITSLGHNLIGDPTDCDITLQPTDLTGNPGLGEFTDDRTPGHGHFPLLASSRAINAGDDEVCPPTDQLGQPRVGICDIGAIEFQSEMEGVTIAIKQGRAERLGTANAKVTLEGRLTGASLADVDLGASTLTITSILNEVGVELVAGDDLPITLEPRPGSDADGATFETPGGARPKVRVDLSHRRKGVVSFRLVLEFAPSQPPASCAGTPRTTALTTSFQLDPGSGPISITTTQPWQCLAGDSQLRVPVP
jgi:hypothetical protein